MKKLWIFFALTSALFSCKKETTNLNTTNDVTISGFDCAGVKIVGTLTKDKVGINTKSWGLRINLA